MKTGIIGATILITSTTIDDAIWLVPYTTASHLPFYTKLIHALTFILTLELLSLLCVGMSSALEHGLIHIGSINEQQIGFIMECFGAALCWLITIFLIVKKIIKRRRRRIKEQQWLDPMPHMLDVNSNSLLGRNINANQNNNNHDHEDTDINTIPTTPSIKTVISFTTLGALDEISYFPALIMSKVFTPMDLCVGALFASILILVVINLFLSQCKPLVDWLDRIPLYGIVGAFAIVLTIGLFV